MPMLMKKNMMAVEKRYSLAAATPPAAELNPLTTAQYTGGGVIRVREVKILVDN